jgi:hypothetical protein
LCEAVRGTAELAHAASPELGAAEDLAAGSGLAAGAGGLELLGRRQGQRGARPDRPVRRRRVVAGAGAAAAVLVLGVWGLSTIDSEPPRSQAAPILDDRTPTPSATVTLTPSAPPPTALPTAPPPSKTTHKPTVRPTKTRTSRTPERAEERDPTPTKSTPSVTRTPRPPRITPTRTWTREELLAEYCRQRGWDPEWCDPDNWEDPHDPQAPPTTQR